MNVPGASRQIVTEAAGTVDVLHRLALAVVPVDAVTGRPCTGVRILRETSRPGRRGRAAGGRPLDPSARLPFTAPLGPDGRGGVLLHRWAGPPKRMTVRIDDPAGRWVARRFEVSPWQLPEVSASDPTPEGPASGTYLPVESRVLRPWLLPSAAHPAAPRATGIRFRVLAGSAPVRWPRVEAFLAGGVRAGWAHGDRHGQVVLLVENLLQSPGPADPAVALALRVHAPDPGRPPPDDLPAETVAPPPPLPPGQEFFPTPPEFDDDLLRGLTIPGDYVTAGEDLVRRLTVGELTTVPDLLFSP